jgi:hypothetical protein
MEDVLKDLDRKLEDFVKVKDEVRGFRKEITSKYNNLNLPDPQDVASLIEKFKEAHPDIILNKD